MKDSHSNWSVQQVTVLPTKLGRISNGETCSAIYIFQPASTGQITTAKAINATIQCVHDSWCSHGSIRRSCERQTKPLRGIRGPSAVCMCNVGGNGKKKRIEMNTKSKKHFMGFSLFPPENRKKRKNSVAPITSDFREESGWPQPKKSKPKLRKMLFY